MAVNDCEHVEQEEIDYGRWGIAIRGGGNFASLATSPIINFTVVDFGWHMMDQRLIRTLLPPLYFPMRASHRLRNRPFAHSQSLLLYLLQLDDGIVTSWIRCYFTVI